MRMMFGGRTTNYDVHYTGFDVNILGHFVLSAGFGEIQRVRDFGIFKDTSTLEAFGVPISLNIVARKL